MPAYYRAVSSKCVPRLRSLLHQSTSRSLLTQSAPPPPPSLPLPVFPSLTPVAQETQRLMADPVPGISATPYQDNLRYFAVAIEGPTDTPYAGGVFQLELFLPAEYPMSPPKVSSRHRVYAVAYERTANPLRSPHLPLAPLASSCSHSRSASSPRSTTPTSTNWAVSASTSSRTNGPPPSRSGRCSCPSRPSCLPPTPTILSTTA
jgi:hypothetical protein